MAEYISQDDIRDDLLNVTEQDISEANIFIEDTANRLGITPDNIRMPLPFFARRLAICFACYNYCLTKVGTDSTSTFDGGDRKDIYAQKLEFYRKEIKEIEAKLTPADFVGKTFKSGNITLGRA